MENISEFQSSKEHLNAANSVACSSALAALPICRNRKLKGHAGADPGGSPHPSAVRFDDRAADRESHAQAVRLGCVECAEKSICILGLDTDTDVLDRHQHPIELVWLRAHDEHAITVADRRHGLHPIDSEIDDHLLQLDSIAADREQARVEVEPYRDSMPKRLVLQERDRLFDDLVDVQWDHLRVDLFRELANPVNHLAGAMARALKLLLEDENLRGQYRSRAPAHLARHSRPAISRKYLTVLEAAANVATGVRLG